MYRYYSVLITYDNAAEEEIDIEESKQILNSFNRITGFDYEDFDDVRDDCFEWSDVLEDMTQVSKIYKDYYFWITDEGEDRYDVSFYVFHNGKGFGREFDYCSLFGTFVEEADV